MAERPHYIRAGGNVMMHAPLALSDGNLVIRDQAQMKCVYVGKGE